MKSYVGQIKWIFVESMNQNADSRKHGVVIVAQEGSQLKGIALSSKQCKALKGQQQGMWDGKMIGYAAFNRGWQVFDEASWKGEKWAYEMPKEDRKRLVREMGEFEKRFGFDVEG